MIPRLGDGNDLATDDPNGGGDGLENDSPSRGRKLYVNSTYCTGIPINNIV